ncbi:hypothetical protein ACJIZ3_002931 [Penstemon smallii]|uniref:Uncharacterized protein n=1 Tax=Penstemon smallii TaxID=265156 RepID=A0ABD3UAE0_9LAMI
MDEYGEYGKCCHLHPRELVVGICAFCLNEKLLVLASKQSHLHQANRTNSGALNFFAITSLFNRFDNKTQKSEPCYSSSTSQEDSFISIKFEDNGVASWDKEKISKIPLDQHYCETSKNESWDKAKKIKSVIEHAKPRATLRWRRRMGHLFQLIRWKRSSKGNMSHVGTKLEGAKAKQVKYGWIRAMTKTRTKE